MNNKNNANIRIFSFILQKQGKKANFMTDTITTSIHAICN